MVHCGPLSNHCNGPFLRCRIGGHGRLSEGWLGYGVYASGCKSENDGWIVGNRVVARTESGLALLDRMSFDKDNPADRSRGTKEEREV